MVDLLLLMAPLLLAASLAGYGAAFSTLVLGRRGKADFFEVAFLGLLLVTLGALGANFFQGLGLNPGPYVLAGGLVLFVFLERCGWLSFCVPSLYAAFLSSLAFWMRSSVTLPYDAGLYYLLTMNWVAHQPLPFGLANLEARLGLDSAWLLFESALRSERALGWSHLVVAEITLRSVAIGWMVQNFLAGKAKGWSAKASFHLVAVILLFVYLLVRSPSPTTTDMPANLLAFCAWVAFGKLLLDGKDGATQNLSFLLLLLVLAVSFKLSVLPVALLPAILAWRLGGRGLRDFVLAEYRLLCLVTLYVILWLARNFALTGCLVFPVAATCFSPLWGMKKEDAPSVAMQIAGAARGTGVDGFGKVALFHFDWVPAWFTGFAKSPEFLLLVGAGFFALLLFVFVRRRRAEPLEFLVGTSLGCAATGLLLWFFLAPNPRFSWCFFLIASASLVYASVCRWDWIPRRTNPISLTPSRVWTLVGLSLLLAVGVQQYRGGGRIDAPVPPSRMVALAPALTIAMPSQGDQCWALFPCAPYGFGYKTVEVWHGRLLFRLEERPGL